MHICVVCGLLIGGTAGAGPSRAGTIEGTVRCEGATDGRGAVVYVDRIPGKTFPPGPEVVVDQEQLTFVPHVLTVVVGTSVVFLNSDDVWHNVFSFSEAKQFNLGINARGTVRRMVFDKPGVVDLLCNVHPEMSAFVVVTETPYAAIVEEGGAFALEAVPAGTCTLVAWREEHEVDRRLVIVPEQGTARIDFALRRSEEP